MNTGQPLGAKHLHGLIGWRFCVAGPKVRGALGRHQRRSIVSGTNMKPNASLSGLPLGKY